MGGNFRQSDVTRMIKAVRGAGVEIGAIEVKPCGTISIILGSQVEHIESDEGKSKSGNLKVQHAHMNGGAKEPPMRKVERGWFDLTDEEKAEAIREGRRIWEENRSVARTLADQFPKGSRVRLLVERKNGWSRMKCAAAQVGSVGTVIGHMGAYGGRLRVPMGPKYL
jgi:hypothetical protein